LRREAPTCRAIGNTGEPRAGAPRATRRRPRARLAAADAPHFPTGCNRPGSRTWIASVPSRTVQVSWWETVDYTGPLVPRADFTGDHSRRARSQDDASDAAEPGAHPCRRFSDGRV